MQNQDNYYPQDVYQSQPVRSDEIYASELQSQRVANIVSQTSPDNQLLEIEWRIRGYRKDMSSGTWIKIDPKCPEPPTLLITNYMSFLGAFCNDNGRFTNLSDIQINNIMGLCIRWIVTDLDDNAEEYNLETNYTERSRIGYIVLASTFFVLCRALNGTESKRMWNSVNMNITEQYGQQQKKGFMDNFKFWKH